MISNAPISSPVSHSVKRTSRSGHIPAVLSISVKAAEGMMTPVRGRAIRLVSMKCTGNVLKYIQTRGAVAAWHDIDIAVEFHIRLAGFVIIADEIPEAELFSGHKPFIRGYMNAIPAIAAYDSWNPTVRTDSGQMQSCITSAVSSTFPVLRYLPVSRAASFSVMNRNALTMEGPAPVARV